MPEIKDAHSFKPNQIKELWLATRKETLQGTEHPGFFQTIGYTTDRNWVIISSIIELAAIFITIQGGIIRGGWYLVAAIAAVLLFVFFDYIGAKLHHSPISHKQEYKCKLALVDDDDNSQNIIIGIRSELNRKSQRKTGGTILIILSAILKLLALFLLGTMGFVFLGIMTVLYILAVYIHLNHTGYFLAEISTRKEINKQHSRWREYNRLINTGDKAKAQNHKGANYVIPNIYEKNTYINKKSLWDHRIEENKKINVGNHYLEFLRKENDNYIYEIGTRGILTDNEVRRFLNSGNQINIPLVAKYFLDQQLRTNSN
jgi:hypothetical protein